MAKEIAALHRILRTEYLSVQQLADQIPIERSTLHRLLFTEGRSPRRNSLDRIRDFLKRRERRRAHA